MSEYGMGCLRMESSSMERQRGREGQDRPDPVMGLWG